MLKKVLGSHYDFRSQYPVKQILRSEIKYYPDLSEKKNKNLFELLLKQFSKQ